MGLIGGNSFGFASARARDGVSVSRLEEALITEVDRLAASHPRSWSCGGPRRSTSGTGCTSWPGSTPGPTRSASTPPCTGDPNLINTRIDEINAVTLDDIAAAQTRWFRSDQRATLIYRQEQS